MRIAHRARALFKCPATGASPVLPAAQWPLLVSGERCHGAPILGGSAAACGVVDEPWPTLGDDPPCCCGMLATSVAGTLLVAPSPFPRPDRSRVGSRSAGLLAFVPTACWKCLRCRPRSCRSSFLCWWQLLSEGTPSLRLANSCLPILLAPQLSKRGYPPREIDISWVSLCVPMRPGKNSFVMMRGARLCMPVSRRSGGDCGVGWLHIAMYLS